MPDSPMSSSVIGNVNSFTQRRFEELSSHINQVQDQIDEVYSHLDSKVNAVYASLSTALQAMNDELTEFIDVQKKANRLNQAETRVVKIRQEIEKKFGHYDIVRRTTQGILQADDLELVKKSTIHNTTEELFITTPNYWLAPCLVALAAWINDDPELAKKAVKEAVRRDDEKTCLFFTILCRRANRMPASLKWVRRYLAQQDETHLNRHAIIILDGLMTGLWGIDSENVISAQLDEWLEKLEAQQNFTENQISVDDNAYKTISRYSPTWNSLKLVLSASRVHDKAYKHFKAIFDRKESVGDTIQVLDELLNNLVTNYDDEEIPLRKEEMLENLIIQYQGDEAVAQSKMEVEKKVFEDEKDYMQLLLEAAFNPDTTHASAATCKFAVAVCKNYIVDAHSEITTLYRSKIPNEIELAIPSTNVTPNGSAQSYGYPEFKNKTEDGSNEEIIINSLTEHTESALQKVISNETKRLNKTKNIVVVIASIIGVIGLIILLTDFVGAVLLIPAIASIPLAFYFIKHKIASLTTAIRTVFEAQRDIYKNTIHTFCAEVVDYRTELASKDKEASNVIEYIDGLVPNEYIHLNAERRRIRNHG